MSERTVQTAGGNRTGKQKNKIRMAVDACMTALLLCLTAYQVTGEAL